MEELNRSLIKFEKQEGCDVMFILDGNFQIRAHSSDLGSE